MRLPKPPPKILVTASLPLKTSNIQRQLQHLGQFSQSQHLLPSSSFPGKLECSAKVPKSEIKRKVRTLSLRWFRNSKNRADLWNQNDQIIEDCPQAKPIQYAMRSTEMAVNCTHVCCNMLYLCRGGCSATQNVLSNMSILVRQCLIIKNIYTTLKEWRSLNLPSSKCRTAQDFKNIKSWSMHPYTAQVPCFDHYFCTTQMTPNISLTYHVTWLYMKLSPTSILMTMWHKFLYKPSFDPSWQSRDLSSPSDVTKEIRSLSWRWSRQVMTFLSSWIGSRDSQLQNVYSPKNSTKKQPQVFNGWH